MRKNNSTSIDKIIMKAYTLINVAQKNWQNYKSKCITIVGDFTTSVSNVPSKQKISAYSFVHIEYIFFLPNGTFIKSA